ncbi:hypothetical protein Acor_55970 [Acrocarpospora corrugata]|uniref:Lipoprotein n=1 Tax=Acrocarpospora corrugata TaxID=35763 RepID=A0A5M3W8V5_9ACTN|nr:hypothetical protein Acor_55970 [Acrocarpospora corrugata]
MPPASAGPREVVGGYIEAVLGKDERTVRAVLVPETDFDNEFTNSIYPFQGWISASGLSIGEPRTSTIDCPDGVRCQRMTVVMDLCAVDNGSYPDGAFAQSFGVRYVKDRWLVSGFGSG